MIKIKVIKDGPYYLDGEGNEFEIEDSSGSQIPSKSKTALCRCGFSNNKPFCDGKHREVGFKSEVVSKE